MKLLFKFALLLPVPLCMSAVNYCVDPAHIYQNGGYERGIARLFLDNKNVANTVNLDEGLLQKYYIEGLSVKREVVVLGSSASRMIGRERFPGASFFNSSVRAAAIEDHMAVYHLYKKHGKLPGTIILGVDAYLFNRNHGGSGLTSLKADYEGFLEHAGIKNREKSAFSLARLMPEKFLELFSPGYFRKSLAMLRARVFRNETGKYYAVEDIPDTLPVRLSDGTFNIDSNRAQTTAQISAGAYIFAHQEPLFGLFREYRELDPIIREHLSSLIDAMLKDGVAVTLFLPPMHPVTYDVFVHAGKCRIILEAQAFVTALATQKRLKLVGSYNPRDCGLSESDFGDGYHLKKEAIQKIFERYTFPANSGVPVPSMRLIMKQADNSAN